MGLVLRAVRVGEADQILSILTPDGIVSASAKGSLRLKHKLFSACGLFCYSEFTLFDGKTMCVVDDAQVRSVFFGLREDVEAMALAMYCAEVAATLSPVGAEAAAQLKLLLNTFYMLSEKKKRPRLVKAVYELRTLSQTGYMPDLVACADCACYEEGGAFYFDAEKARFFCADCAAARGLTPNLSRAALSAMRYIVYSDDGKIFSFELGEEALTQLSFAAGQYAALCLDKPMKTLDFLETILT